MEFLMHFLPWQPVEENGHRSLGFQGAIYSELGQWRWINGLDADYTDGWLKEVQADGFSPNQPAGVHYDYQVDATMAAAFSQLEWALNKLELSAGLRYEYSRYDYDNKTGDGPACAPEATACRFYRPAGQERTILTTGLSMQVAAIPWEKNHQTYLRYANGFRAPQATELYRLQAGQQVADLDSEELDNLEVGLRGVFSGKLNYDLSLFYMTKDDVIFQDANRQNISGASTKHQGLEFNLGYRFNDNWYVNGVGSVCSPPL